MRLQPARVAEYAAEYFNDLDEAVDLLGEWKLKSSEDVGAVIYAMVRAGLLLDSSTDKPEDFRGLFTLRALFDKQQ